MDVIFAALGYPMTLLIGSPANVALMSQSHKMMNSFIPHAAYDNFYTNSLEMTAKTGP